MDEVAADVAHEGIAAILGRVGRAPIDRDAGGRGEEAGGEQLGRRQPLRHHRDRRRAGGCGRPARAPAG